MSKNPGLTIGQIGLEGKTAMAFAASTVKAYAKLAIQLHQAACITFFRAAEYGDCDSLNLFFAGLRVNDQTALRVWIGQHSSYVNLDNQEVKNWIKWNAKDGFKIVNGVEAHRKGMFTIDEQVEGKTMLIGLKPFYDKNVKDKDAITLEELAAMFSAVAKRVKSKAESEGLTMPVELANLVNTVDREAAAITANLKRVVTE